MATLSIAGPLYFSSPYSLYLNVNEYQVVSNQDNVVIGLTATNGSSLAVHAIIGHWQGDRFIVDRTTQLSDNYSIEYVDEIQFDLDMGNSGDIYIGYTNPQHQLLFRKSINLGLNWSAEENLTGTGYFVIKPAIKYLPNGDVIVFFHGETPDQEIELYYLIGNNKAASFASVQTLVQHLSQSFYPAIENHHNAIYLIWASRSPELNEDPLYFDLYLSRSLDFGQNWLPEKRLTGNSGDNFKPDILLLRNHFLLAWESNQYGNWSVLAGEFQTDGRPMQDTPHSIVNPMAEAHKPHLVQTEDKIYIFWEDYRSGSLKPYYARYNPLSERMFNHQVEFNDFDIEIRNLTPLNVNNRVGLFAQSIDRNALLYLSPAQSPQAPSVRLEGEMVEVYNYTPIELSWSIPENKENITAFYYSISKVEEEIPPLINPINPLLDKIYIVPPDDGVWYFNLVYEDRFGTISKVISKKILLDTIPPKQPQPEYTLEENSVNVQWEPIEDAYKYEYSYSKAVYFEENNKSEIYQNQVNLPIQGSGQYYFHIRALDRANNLSLVYSMIIPIASQHLPMEDTMNEEEEITYTGFSWPSHLIRPISPITEEGFILDLKKEYTAVPLITISHQSFTDYILNNYILFIIAILVVTVLTLSVLLIRMARRPIIPVGLVRDLLEKQKQYDETDIWEDVPEAIEVVSDYEDIDISTHIEKEADEKSQKISGGLGLRAKYSLLVTFIVVITIVIGNLINGYITLSEMKVQITSDSISMAENMLNQFSRVAKEAIISENDAMLVDVIRVLEKNENIYEVGVIRKNPIYGDDQWYVLSAYGERELLDTSLLQHLSDTTVFFIPPLNFSNLMSSYKMGTIISDRIGSNRNIMGIAFFSYSTQFITESLAMRRESILINTLLLGLILLMLGFILALVFATITITPIKRLMEGVLTVGSGNLDYQLPVKTRDEIGKLTLEFNKMTRSLKEAQEILIRERVNREQLKIAESIQRSLLPKTTLSSSELQIGGLYKPAFGVGGDFYDYMELDQHRKLGVIIGDVAGKGVPAALVMTLIHSLIKSYFFMDRDIPNLMNLLNLTISKDFAAQHFATMLLCIYDRESRFLQYANAGHTPFIIYHKQTDQIETSTLEDTPLGVQSSSDFRVANLTLLPGDTVLFYTDGLTEALNDKGEEFGLIRLQTFLKEYHHKNTMDFCQSLLSNIEEFSANVPQRDDMSIVVLKIAGSV